MTSQGFRPPDSSSDLALSNLKLEKEEDQKSSQNVLVDGYRLRGVVMRLCLRLLFPFCFCACFIQIKPLNTLDMLWRVQFSPSLIL